MENPLSVAEWKSALETMKKETAREIFRELASECPHEPLNWKGGCANCYQALKAKWIGGE